jgi:hypothetical protein
MAAFRRYNRSAAAKVVVFTGSRLMATSDHWPADDAVPATKGGKKVEGLQGLHGGRQVVRVECNHVWLLAWTVEPELRSRHILGQCTALLSYVPDLCQVSSESWRCSGVGPALLKGIWAGDDEGPGACQLGEERKGLARGECIHACWLGADGWCVPVSPFGQAVSQTASQDREAAQGGRSIQSRSCSQGLHSWAAGSRGMEGF